MTRLLRERLLAWYDAHRRDLPWRSPPGEAADPYRVWISEVMLQQTQVERVKGYFTRWVERYPTLDALAAAPLDEVLRAWEGLGYYSRARNLHAAAREAAAAYGAVPDDPERFRALPGVGRYTTGAVMSIAFAREEPVVDGNVRRVFSRLWNVAEPREPWLWERAEELVRGDRPGDLNQALMELGATVCTPRSPRCPVCPVSEHCQARASGTQEERPLRKRKAPVPREQYVSAIVERGGRLLLTRRPINGRLGGLWEFPSLQGAPGETTEESAARVALQRGGVQVQALDPICHSEQTLSHVTMAYVAVHCMWVADLEAGAPEGARVWVEPAELRNYPMSRAQRRIAAMVAPSIPTLFTAEARRTLRCEE